MKAEAKKVGFELDPPFDFLQRLWELNHALERMSLQMDRNLGITGQQRFLLRCLGKYPDMTASQLAEVLHLDRGTVSVSLQRLVKKGLVIALRDKADQRRISLRLTRRGRGLDRPESGSVEGVVERMLAKAGKPSVQKTKQVLRLLSLELAAKLEP